MRCGLSWSDWSGLLRGLRRKARAAAPSGGPQSLQIVELKPGDGAAVAAGQIAVVQYTGWLYEASAPDNKGKQFDSSRGGAGTLSFPVGRGEVIKGWDQGVAGMKVGGAAGSSSRRISLTATAAPAASFRPAPRWYSTSISSRSNDPRPRAVERLSSWHRWSCGPARGGGRGQRKAGSAMRSCAIRIPCTAAPWTTKS
jgi:hypothetical protein